MRSLGALLLALVLAAGFGLPTQAQTTREAWSLDRLESALAEAPRERVWFDERRHVSYLEQPLKVEGYLDRPSDDRLEKHITAPRRESFIIDGGRVTVTGPDGGVRHFSVTDHPMLHALAFGLRAVLASELSVVRRRFYADLQGNYRQWRLRLFPRGEALQQELEVLEIVGAGGRLSAVTAVEANGDRTVTTLRDAP